MTTQFPDAVSDRSVTLSPTAHRVTPEPAQPFASVLRASASAVVGGAEAAAQRLPGGPLMSAAFRPGSDAPGAPSGYSAGTPTGLDGGSLAAASEPIDPMQSAVQTQAETSLYFLQLQQQIQEENRTYSTLSNVMKARHETVKNAIGNIR